MLSKRLFHIGVLPIALATIGITVEANATPGQAAVSHLFHNQPYAFADEPLATGPRVSAQSYGSLEHRTVSDGYIQPGTPFVYTEFGGSKETVVPWAGTNVAVLVPKSESKSLSPEVMTETINALDSSWADYRLTTGQSPVPYRTYDGLDSIAVVPQAKVCSGAGDAACSYLGATGTEIGEPYFQTLYNGVADNNQYDQALFYEFGRNFWFYGSSLAPSDTYGNTVTTGFAVLMRFKSMDATGTPGGPFNGTAFPTFEAQDWALVYDYDSDLSDTFANTLAVGASPGMYGGTDFFASILNLLTRYGGDCFLNRFLTDASNEPNATTDDAAVTNFVNAASEAANVDLGPFFYNYWGFPKANGKTRARVAGGISNLPRLGNTPSC